MDSDRPLEDDGSITVRTLKASDLPRLVKIDQHWVGRNRFHYLEGKLQRALSSDVRISLGAEVDGNLVGAVLGGVHYGEFGQAEPVAVLDTILVDKDFSGKGVGKALMEQLLKNLQALRIERLRTEVEWTDQQLIGFLQRAGFVPVPRLVLERAV